MDLDIGTGFSEHYEPKHYWTDVTHHEEPVYHEPLPLFDPSVHVQEYYPEHQVIHQDVEYQPMHVTHPEAEHA